MQERVITMPKPPQIKLCRVSGQTLTKHDKTDVEFGCTTFGTQLGPNLMRSLRPL